MLDVVQGAELMQCVAVVTRYFGGILLGTGGLVRAYSHAAARAVEAAGRVCMKPCVLMETVCDYAQYGRLLPYIAASGGTVEDTVFAEGVSLRFRLPEDESARFEKGLADLTAGTVSARGDGLPSRGLSRRSGGEIAQKCRLCPKRGKELYRFCFNR